MTHHLDYLTHLQRESARFVEALRATPSDARVPTCPDWDADDLLWHLAEVQWFWGEVVRQKITDGKEADALDAGERPAGRAGLESFYASASSGLAQVLTDNAPDTTVWTWSTEQSVGFIRRRQAHEALVHRLDAELTAGDRTPLDPALSADGVDEVLRVMYGGCPPWGTIAADGDGPAMRLRATDTGDSWLVTPARFTGTDPDGKSYDEADIHVATEDPGTDAAATVSGTAEDLNCWLWHRPARTEPERTGDLAVVTRFEEHVSRGVQ